MTIVYNGWGVGGNKKCNIHAKKAPIDRSSPTRLAACVKGRLGTGF
jgi:hypothetical protein